MEARSGQNMIIIFIYLCCYFYLFTFAINRFWNIFMFSMNYLFLVFANNCTSQLFIFPLNYLPSLWIIYLPSPSELFLYPRNYFCIQGIIFVSKELFSYPRNQPRFQNIFTFCTFLLFALAVGLAGLSHSLCTSPCTSSETQFRHLPDTHNSIYATWKTK